MGRACCARVVRLGLVVCVAALAACGGDDKPAAPMCVIDRSPRDDIQRATQSVYYGTLLPSLVPMSPGERLAIGKLDIHGAEGHGLCSGTVVAPEWVLTAEHCVRGATASDLVFSVGHMPDRPTESVRVARFEVHPDADLALLHLAMPITDLAPELKPIRVIEGRLDQSWVGRMVEASGYGETQDGSLGTRYFTVEPITSVFGSEITVDGRGVRGLCLGDSGGPLLTIAGDGTARVIGALSYGDASCVGFDHYARVDLRSAWIAERAQPLPVGDGTECGALDGVGRCSGSVAVYCDAEQALQVEACGAAAVCAWSADASAYRCVARGADPCGGVDARGRCEGETAVVCVDGELRRHSCGFCGMQCVGAGLDGVQCRPPESGPCGGLDYQGRCDGDVAEWCEAGTVRRENCALRGQSCGWRDSTAGYFCRD